MGSNKNEEDDKYYPYPGYFAYISIFMGLMSFAMMFIPLTTGSLVCFLPAFMGVVFGACGIKSPRRGLSIIGIILCLCFFAFIVLGVTKLMYDQGLL